ncbi:MAG TPA: hypothetical protein VFG62_16655 [Rhodopila sp.]|jgi:hypothetical protein|nr:hypothetical protein [Rhodopila sp.]
MAATEAQKNWVVRVLGVKPAGATPSSQGGNVTERWRAARAAWQDAIETVDGQISALQKVMRDSDDEALEEIAEYGLNALTRNHKVPLMAAMMEIGAGSAESLAKSGAKALAAARAFRTHIESDERVAACDENPGGVQVSIRNTLGPALAQIEAALS